MKLSPEKIEHIAKLARLKLSEEEKEQYAEELSVVLDYIEKLQEVDTTDVEPTAQVTGLENVVREDKAKEVSKEKRKHLIKEFPQREGRMLKVQEVFDNN
jgi:aspartyl-tRNA(Asn)/glutamyl-tRNA(Gln) amidotransferase subunit C